MKKYEIISATERGESHKKKGIVREDSVGSLLADHYMIIAVSDGHGDPNCFRSDRGSNLAVETCLLSMQEFADGFLTEGKLSEEFKVERSRDKILQQLVSSITVQWNLRIMEDLEKDPIVPERDYKACSTRYINLYDEKEKLSHIYGATLLGVLMMEGFIITIQLGDGSTVFLEKDGTFHLPVPGDERCVGSQTTSLCEDDAISSFRFYVREMVDGQEPAAVFIASDGIEDSFRSNDLMYCFHRDICCRIVKDGIESAQKYLYKTGLPELSEKGSGDDVSIAGVVDVEAITPFVKDFEDENQILQITEESRYFKEHMDSIQPKRIGLKKELDQLRDDSLQYEKKRASIESKMVDIQKRISQAEISISNRQVKINDENRCKKELENEYSIARDEYNQIDQIYQLEVTKFNALKDDYRKKRIRPSEIGKQLKKVISNVRGEFLNKDEDWSVNVNDEEEVDLKEIERRIDEGKNLLRKKQRQVSEKRRVYEARKMENDSIAEKIAYLINEQKKEEVQINTNKEELKELKLKIDSLEEKSKKETKRFKDKENEVNECERDYLEYEKGYKNMMDKVAAIRQKTD